MTALRARVSAASTRAAVAKGDYPIAEAGAQADPFTVSRARCAELRTRLDNVCCQMRELTKATGVATPRFVYDWACVANSKGEVETAMLLR